MKLVRIHLKKSGMRVPRVELEEVGPSADLVLRRSKIASDDLYRRAKKQPDAAKVCTHAFCHQIHVKVKRKSAPILITKRWAQT